MLLSEEYLLSSMGEVEKLRALSKQYSDEIIVALERPRTAGEIANEFDIPIATVYRRLEELEGLGLIEPYTGDIISTGADATPYIRGVSAIRVDFTDELSITLEEADEGYLETQEQRRKYIQERPSA